MSLLASVSSHMQEPNLPPLRTSPLCVHPDVELAQLPNSGSLQLEHIAAARCKAWSAGAGSSGGIQADGARAATAAQQLEADGAGGAG